MSNHTTKAKTYHGTPCKKAGHTLRYASTGTCVACVREDAHIWGKENKERKAANGQRWLENNREKTRESNRRWRKNNPEGERQAQARYYKAHRNKKLKSNKKWYEANSDKKLEQGRRWRRANPEKEREIKHRRRARKRDALSETYDFEAICNYYGNKCLKCGASDVKLTVDHVIPFSKGGDDVVSNIQPLCGSCNSSKRDRHIDYRRDTLERRPEVE